jgi:hypothetical protein
MITFICWGKLPLLWKSGACMSYNRPQAQRAVDALQSGIRTLAQTGVWTGLA